MDRISESHEYNYLIMNIIKLMAFVAPAGLYVLASFHSEAMGMFLHPLSVLGCKLEPLNHYDSNCIALLVSSSAAGTY